MTSGDCGTQLAGALSVCCAVLCGAQTALTQAGSCVCDLSHPAQPVAIPCKVPRNREGGKFQDILWANTTPVWKQELMATEASTSTDIHGEQQAFPGRGDLDATPGAGITSNPFMPTIQRIHRKCSYSTTLQSDQLSYKWASLFQITLLS